MYLEESNIVDKSRPILFNFAIRDVDERLRNFSRLRSHVSNEFQVFGQNKRRYVFKRPMARYNSTIDVFYTVTLRIIRSNDDFTRIGH